MTIVIDSSKALNLRPIEMISSGIRILYAKAL